MCISASFQGITISETQIFDISSSVDYNEILRSDPSRETVVEILNKDTILYETWEILFTDTNSGSKTCGILKVRSPCDGTQAAVTISDGKYLFRGDYTYTDI